MYSRILIPTDGSTAAGNAVEHGLELASRYDASVYALYVVEPVYAAEGGGEQIIQALESEGETAINLIAEQADELGLQAETALRHGSPHREILDYIGEQDIDLVVMGTHGRTGLDRYLLGSVTEKVVRLADVPVLTVAFREDEDPEPA